MIEQKASPSSFLRWREIPGGVWTLGFVSLLMDVSSEMIHALLPLYLAAGFGASMLTIGVIEGLAEATALIVRVFSGALSDALGKRKLLAALGYGLAAFTKPVFPLAPSIAWIVTARVIDRIGKGIRGAPRDALIADLTPGDLRGTSFGLRQSLDTVGAFVGPLAAIGLMLVFANDFATVFWIAVIPAAASFLLIVFAVREPDGIAPTGESKVFDFGRLRALPRGCWLVVGLGALFTLARFSEAFLILRTNQLGLPLAIAPLALIVMNLAYAPMAWRRARSPIRSAAWVCWPLGSRCSRWRRLGWRLPPVSWARSSALCFGVCISASRRACSPPSSPTRRLPICAAPRSACSTWCQASQC